MEFIKTREVPLTHSIDTRLQRFAKARGVSVEEAAAIAVGDFLIDQGELEARIAEARATLERAHG